MTAAIGSRGFWLQIIPMFYGATVFQRNTSQPISGPPKGARK
jgi:hypothetical protein